MASGISGGGAEPKAIITISRVTPYDLSVICLVMSLIIPDALVALIPWSLVERTVDCQKRIIANYIISATKKERSSSG